MRKEKKAELLAIAIIGYIFLLIIVLVIYLIFAHLVDLKIFGEQSDQSTILTNLFIWSATLYTPLLAYIAYSDWKEQKHYDVVINTLNEMVDTVNNLSTEIDTFRGKSIYEPLFNNGIDFKLDLNELQDQQHIALDEVKKQFNKLKSLELKIKITKNLKEDHPVLNESFSDMSNEILQFSSAVTYIYLRVYKIKKEIHDSGKEIETYSIPYTKEEYQKFIRLSFFSEMVMAKKAQYNYSEIKEKKIENLFKNIMEYRKRLN